MNFENEKRKSFLDEYKNKSTENIPSKICNNYIDLEICEFNL